ncbi:VOC family protein [Demequina sp. SYSU T00039]|uniref:VOC family protein n=1 Tax=Demequina lignilytica TaxID=3051663 RepID=A0AAW7M7U2_9MICO|nr:MULTISPECIES: VOC family protein [unclassified Demequina]MDN4477042.1 VOC family protein [Demequina sp. SYSU T00039-1]MDN4487215.1 VOC family protein [Demequina sp. SYSU T00039]MDN4491790.1 VOC family protein [Demequina sp. SYSU T00068]
MSEPAGAVQLRLVVHAEDLDAAVAFFRDALGLPAELDLTSPTDGPGEDARVVVLGAGRATLELVNTPQRALIDSLEVGRDASREIRVALEVDDAADASARAVAAGAVEVAPPTPTPWGSLNARLEGPAGLQLTLFQQVEPE